MWTTRFEEYEDVQRVLFPTKWRPSGGSAGRPPYSSTILLNVAFNGEEPSQVPPEAEEPTEERAGD